MKALLILLGIFGLCTTSYGSSLRHNINAFEQAAPDVHAYRDYLTDSNLKDEEEIDEQLAENEKTIAAISKLISAKKSDKNFELRWRLAELQQDRFHFLRAREIRDYQKAYDLFRWSDGKLKEPVFSLEQSEEALLKRVNALRDLAANHEKDKRYPMAVALLAETQARLGQDLSLNFFNTLFRRFSKSPDAKKARVSVGDYYFAKGEWEKAEAAYKVARKFKDPLIKPFADYKLGWVYYLRSIAEKNKSKRKEDIERCIAGLKLTVLQLKEQTRVGRFDLRKEALMDFSWLMASLGRAKEAYEFFDKVQAKDAPWLFNMVYAEQLMRQKKYGDAISVYQKLLEEFKTKKELPEFYASMTQAAVLGSTPEKAIGFMNELLTSFTDKNQDFYKAFAKQPEMLERSARILELSLRSAGNILYSAAQNSQDSAFRKGRFALAVGLFERYLELVPLLPDHEAQSIRFNLASSFFLMEDFTRATQEFENVATFPVDKIEKRNVARYYKVLSLQNLASKEPTDGLPVFGKATEPVPISPTKRRLLAEINKFKAIDATNEDLPGLMIASAMIFYSHGQYTEALPRLEELSGKLIDREEGVQTSQLVLAHYLESKNWQELSRFSNAMLKVKVKNRELKKSLIEHRDYAKYMLENG